jgi:hypothetical protein
LNESEFNQQLVGGVKPGKSHRLKAASKTAADNDFNQIVVPTVAEDSDTPWLV